MLINRTQIALLVVLSVSMGGLLVGVYADQQIDNIAAPEQIVVRNEIVLEPSEDEAFLAEIESLQAAAQAVETCLGTTVSYTDSGGSTVEVTESSPYAVTTPDLCIGIADLSYRKDGSQHQVIIPLTIDGEAIVAEDLDRFGAQACTQLEWILMPLRMSMSDYVETAQPDSTLQMDTHPSCFSKGE